MNIKIHSLHFDADVKLLDFVESKVGKLAQYYDNIIDVEVTLRIDSSENFGNKVADIKVLIPGNDLFSKRQAKSFEEATGQATEALRRQLKKTKEKQRKNNT
ncbi:MAG: ribosome-associated translation inhibitor RaiA [Salinivirgaceae bacterium]|jgi:putative sigma-54 modulation protein|nr:ribosome-associated translation inhibitor RaiA [Salinivirgaceae bacterium]